MRPTDTRANGTSVKSATIYDVAEAADVSPQTVSRVLRGFEGVRPKTRERVQKAVEALGYTPNLAARSLRTRRANRIAVLVHGLGSTGPARTLEGASLAARKHGYVLDIVPMDGDDPASVAIALELAADHRIAGIIATAQTESVRETLARQATDVPTVLQATTVPAGYDLTHDESMGAIAAEHVVGLGHTRIAYVRGPSTWDSARERQHGFAERTRALGAEVVQTLDGDWSAASGYRAAHELLEDPRGATTIAAANDDMAVGAIAALHEQGMHVPDDYSVMGTDDVPSARFHVPALSTIAIDFEGEGRYLVERLLIDIGVLTVPAATPPEPPALVPRASTAARA